MTEQQQPAGGQAVYERRAIAPLAGEVAERIAAGEVIERPVSVIKELVENALDAGAGMVRVEVRGGGLNLMQVSDDGVGIPEEELAAASARHNTSKISRVEDLAHLSTLGFRGEALASIGTVSELTLHSQTVEMARSEIEQSGAYLIMRGGEQVQRGRRARLQGTTVTVRELFYNVPARLKFMRQGKTEGNHILQLVRRYALGYPGVRFTLLLDGQVALQTSGGGSLEKTLTELYRLPLSELLHPIHLRLSASSRGSGRAGGSGGTSSGVSELTGSVGNRALAQSSRQHLTLFVNGRLVQSKALQEAMEAGYRGLLPRGQHPLAVLHLRVPPEEIDVNIHPAKTEVLLARGDEIAPRLSAAVREVLERSPALPTELGLPGPTLATQGRLPGTRRRGLRIAESAGEYRADDEAAGQSSGEGQSQPGATEILRGLRPLAQLQRAVILAEAPDGSLYLIDQHRAHERVIYEHLRQRHARPSRSQSASAATWSGEPFSLSDGTDTSALARTHEPGESFSLSSGTDTSASRVGGHLLLEPVVVELKRHEAELFEQRLPLLSGLGLVCERFGGRSFLVRGVPGGTGEADQLAQHVPELVHLAAEEGPDWQDRLLIGLACRSALRRGRELTPAEQRQLIAALAEVDAPAVCPHGSPIVLHYSRTFLINTFEW